MKELDFSKYTVKEGSLKPIQYKQAYYNKVKIINGTPTISVAPVTYRMANNPIRLYIDQFLSGFYQKFEDGHKINTTDCVILDTEDLKDLDHLSCISELYDVMQPKNFDNIFVYETKYLKKVYGIDVYEIFSNHTKDIQQLISLYQLGNNNGININKAPQDVVDQLSKACDELNTPIKENNDKVKEKYFKEIIKQAKKCGLVNKSNVVQ